MDAEENNKQFNLERDLWLLALGGALVSDEQRKRVCGLAPATCPLGEFHDLIAAIKRGDGAFVWKTVGQRFGIHKDGGSTVGESLVTLLERRAISRLVRDLSASIRKASEIGDDKEIARLGKMLSQTLSLLEEE